MSTNPIKHWSTFRQSDGHDIDYSSINGEDISGKYKWNDPIIKDLNERRFIKKLPRSKELLKEDLARVYRNKDRYMYEFNGDNKDIYGRKVGSIGTLEFNKGEVIDRDTLRNHIKNEAIKSKLDLPDDRLDQMTNAIHKDRNRHESIYTPIKGSLIGSGIGALGGGIYSVVRNKGVKDKARLVRDSSLGAAAGSVLGGVTSGYYQQDKPLRGLTVGALGSLPFLTSAYIANKKIKR